MSSLRLALYQGGEAWGNWLDFVFLPVRATLMGLEGGPGYSASIGPLLVGLSLAAVLIWRMPDELAALANPVVCVGGDNRFSGLDTWQVDFHRICCNHACTFPSFQRWLFLRELGTPGFPGSTWAACVWVV